MKVWIDRDTCDSNLSACISCFGQLLRTGALDRACILDYEDDGTEDMTIIMHSDGEDRDPIFIPEEDRELVAFEGWDQFVPWKPRFSRYEGTQLEAKK